MPYTSTTLSDVITSVSSRLGDSGNIYFTQDEVTLYIYESLRTWNSLTNYWKQRGTFDTVVSIPFYDLPTQLPALRAYTVTVQDIVKSLEYHLIEPATVPTWTGTAMFTMTDLVNAIQRRRNQFIKDSGTVISFSIIDTVPPNVSRVPLDESIIDVIRAAWIDSDGTVSPVDRSDEFRATSFVNRWSLDTDTPASYSLSASPPLTLQLIPAPASEGDLSLLTVNSGSTLDIVANSLLNIPDDLAWIIKWGALADLLSMDGPARDMVRANYCEQRYQQGIKLARSASSVLNIQINGVDVQLSTVESLDNFNPSWQSTSSTNPADIAALVGLNLIAVSPLVNEIDSITVDIVRNAPLPVSSTDPLQLGLEDLDAIIDYSCHLALFKEGGADFLDSSNLYQRFINNASVYNDRLKAINFSYTTMLGYAQNNFKQVNRRDSDSKLTPVGAL